MRRSIRMLSSVAILSAAAACAVFPPTLVERGIVSLDIPETKPVRVSSAKVYREGGQTVVWGQARYLVWKWGWLFKGHIDIDIALPAGDVVKRRNVLLIAKKWPKKIGRRAYFVARFPVDPPKGTIVRIVYHEGTDHELG